MKRLSILFLLFCSFTLEALAATNKTDRQDVKSSEETSQTSSDKAQSQESIEVSQPSQDQKENVINPLTNGNQPLQFILAMNAKDAVIQGQLTKFRLLWSLMNKSGPWAYRLLQLTIQYAQDPQFLETLLKSNTLDLNTKTFFPSIGSQTVWSIAIVSNNLTLQNTQALLNAGADPNIGDFLPLHEAVRSSPPEVVEALLEGKADPNIPSTYAELPLHTAIKMQSLERVQILLDNGAKPNIPNEKGQSALHVSLDLKPWYAQRSIPLEQQFTTTLNIIKSVLDAGAAPNAPSPEGQHPLHMVLDLKSDKIATAHIPIVLQTLLDAGADPNATTNDDQKETLLQRTIDLYPQFASMILSHPQINIHATNASGETALYTAAFRTDPQIVEELIAMGAHPSFTLLERFVTLISSAQPSTDRGYEIRRRREETLSILLDNHKLDPSLLTKLLPVSIGAPKTTEMLLETKGIDVEAKDAQGQTIVHKAVLSHMSYELELLLQNPEVRAIINEPNKAGDAPLHDAIVSLKVLRGPQDIHILLRAGADPKATDGQGRTPLELLLSVMNMAYAGIYESFRYAAKALIERGTPIPENIRGPIAELIFGQIAIDLVGQENLESLLAGCYD